MHDDDHDHDDDDRNRHENHRSDQEDGYNEELSASEGSDQDDVSTVRIVTTILLLLLVLLISVGIASAFILTTADRDMIDIQTQCLRDGQITLLSPETLARLDSIRAALGLIPQHGDDNNATKSCDPEHMPLLLLASDRTVSVSNVEILLTRYVLYVLYFSMGGKKWHNNSGWLDTHYSCTPCCLYGVICEGDSVIEINLSSNWLSGSIPSELGLLSPLRQLDLTNNNIVGEIPTFLRQLTNLVHMSLAQNQISGKIPTDLGLLTDLETLFLNSNLLSGRIPEELASLTQLTILYIGTNKINVDSTMPMWILQMTSLEDLALDYCGINGRLPSQLGLMSSLVLLSLESNDFTGPIPSDIGGLTGLHMLNLFGNSLNGTLPEAVVKCTGLTHLILGQNDLTGTIPNEVLGQLSQLSVVDLASNFLSGSISASNDCGLCGLRKNGNLIRLGVDCLKDSDTSHSKQKVVCPCCTDCQGF
jgi:Leucine-rich repeat (LRR) protein